MAQTTAPALSVAVAAKYNLIGIRPGKCFLPARYGRKEVDFTTMTLEQADALVAEYEAFPYLKLKAVTPPKAQ